MYGFLERYSRKFRLTANTIDFSRDDYQGPPMTDLLDVIDYVKPTALLGLSTITVAILFLNCSRNLTLNLIRRARLLRKSLMQWLPLTLVQSFSHSRTPSSSPSALSLMPLRIPEALFSLHQDPLSQSNSIRAKLYTLVKGTTCTSSLVRCHG